jgi:hypothetical protein
MQNFVNVFGISVFREEHTSKVIFTFEKFLGKNAHDNDAYGTCLDYLGACGKMRPTQSVWQQPR